MGFPRVSNFMEIGFKIIIKFSENVKKKLVDNAPKLLRRFLRGRASGRARWRTTSSTGFSAWPTATPTSSSRARRRRAASARQEQHAGGKCYENVKKIVRKLRKSLENVKKLLENVTYSNSPKMLRNNW